jgi:small subunit ribosomal protein S8
MTDPIADMLTRLRNAAAVSSGTVSLPHSKLKEAVLKTLQNEGYISGYLVETDTSTVFKTLKVTLKYAGKAPAITKIKRISKPGRRVYVKNTDIKAPLSGFGITILSTSQGVMTNREAQKRKLGGEILCQIW